MRAMTATAAFAGDGAARGVVFNVQRCSIHDGPGVRTTVFLKGCPLSCAWCHNPESRAFAPELAVHRDRCIACGACVEACPGGQEGARPGTAVTGGARCLRCGACVSVCPSGARELLGNVREVPDVLAEVERDRPFFAASGGGVTFSGGEPLAQPGFLLACLEACRAGGLHTAVDTCGHAEAAALRAVAAAADLILFDLKLADAEAHRRHTGVDNALILANLEAASAAAAELWLRIPLIPAVNDAPAALDGLAAVARSLPNRHRVFLLPCHDLGGGKRRRLAAAETGAAFRALDEVEVAAAAARLAGHGLDVTVGGAP